MSEINAKIAQVWKDKSLTPVQRQEQIQQLLSPRLCADVADVADVAIGSSDDDVPVCDHYRRHNTIVAMCCQKEFGCRLCHDDNSDHKINRFITQQHFSTS